MIEHRFNDEAPLGWSFVFHAIWRWRVGPISQAKHLRTYAVLQLYIFFKGITLWRACAPVSFYDAREYAVGALSVFLDCVSA